MGAARKAPHEVFCMRLKQAREAAGLSQKQLGIKAGIDRFVASTRINRYEQGVHQPDLDTAGRMAMALNVPLAYLFAADDGLADTIEYFSKAPRSIRDRVTKALRDVEQ